MKTTALIVCTILLALTPSVSAVAVGATCAKGGSGTDFCDANLYCDTATAKCVNCPAGTARSTAQSTNADETVAKCTTCSGYWNAAGTACTTNCGTTTADSTKCAANYYCDATFKCVACTGGTVRTQTTAGACVASGNNLFFFSAVVMALLLIFV